MLQEDLGRLLAWEDLQQFLGRLRRDGTAIFYSLRTLRRAALGPGAEEAEDLAEREYQRDVEVAVLEMQGKSRDSDAEADALKKLAELKGRSIAETGALATACVMSLVLPAPSGLPDGLPKVHPSEPAGTDKDLLAQLAKQLETNGEMLEAMMKKRADQILAINKVEALALSASPFVKRTGGVRYLGAAAKTLQVLYDADVFSEEAVIAWGQQKEAALSLDPDMDARNSFDLTNRGRSFTDIFVQTLGPSNVHIRAILEKLYHAQRGRGRSLVLGYRALCRRIGRADSGAKRPAAST